MTFLTPMAALIAAGVATPLLVALYFLKLRRRELPISSTLLWKRAVQDLQVNAPFQRLRKNLLLLLQLLILAGLILALGRPTFKASAQPGERLIVVIDQSASMNAADVVPTRLDHARKLALELVNRFDGTGGVMVLSFAQQARVIQPFTTDRNLVRQAINSIQATDQPTQLEPLLHLLEPHTPPIAGTSGASAGGTTGSGSGGGSRATGAGGGRLSVYVLSDGRHRDRATMSLRGVDLKYVATGQAADEKSTGNLAIVSFSARRDFARPQRVQVYVRLSNNGAQAAKTTLTLTVDGQAVAVSDVDVPGAGTIAPSSSAPPPGDGTTTPSIASQPSPSAGAAGFSAELGASGFASVTFPPVTITDSAVLGVEHDYLDDLAVDNRAWLILPPPRPLRVLLVSEGNAFLERAIESVGVKRLVQMTPKRYEDQDPRRLIRGAGGDLDEGFDVIFFDGYGPKAAPPVDSVFLGAAPPVPGLSLRGPGKEEPATQMFLSWERDHPLLRYVALDDVYLLEPGRLVLPDRAAALATAQSGPVLAQVEEANLRYVVSSFQVLKTNWPMQISFAVFVSNCVQSLGLGSSGAAGLSYQTGEVAMLRTRPGAGELAYDGPVPLRLAVEQERAVTVLDRAGLYRAREGALPPDDQLAVNLVDALESDIRPADRLEVGTTAVAATPSSATVRREIWPWFLLGALVILMLEWLVYTRRMHL